MHFWALKTRRINTLNEKSIDVREPALFKNFKWFPFHLGTKLFIHQIYFERMYNSYFDFRLSYFSHYALYNNILCRAFLLKIRTTCGKNYLHSWASERKRVDTLNEGSVNNDWTCMAQELEIYLFCSNCRTKHFYYQIHFERM